MISKLARGEIGGEKLYRFLCLDERQLRRLRVQIIRDRVYLGE